MQPLVAYPCSWVEAETLRSTPAFPSLWGEPPSTRLVRIVGDFPPQPQAEPGDSIGGLLGRFCRWAPRAASPIPSPHLCPICSPGQGFLEAAGEVKSPLWGLGPLPCLFPTSHLKSREMTWGMWCLSGGVLA